MLSDLFSRKYVWFFLALIALLVRLPGLGWGIDFLAHNTFVIPLQDEYTATKNMIWPFLQTGKMHRLDYFYGFPAQVIWTSQLIQPFIEPLSQTKILLIARLLSIAFGLASVLLTCWIAHLLFKNIVVTFLAGIFVALSPLHVTHSHYATPTMSAIFWTYAVFLCALLFFKTRRLLFLIIACLASGAGIAVKFSLITLIPVFYIFWKQRHRWLTTWTGFPLLLFSFYVWNLGKIPLKQLALIGKTLIPDNYLIRDHSLWLNPFIYIINLIPALGLPVFIFFGIGLAALIREKWFDRHPSSWHRDRSYCLEVPLLCYVLIICFLVLPFARHLLLLVPYVGIVAAYGFTSTMKRLHPRGTIFLFVLVFLYQSLCVAWNERRYIQDPVFALRAWVLHNTSPQEKVWFYYPGLADYPLFPAEKIADSSLTADYVLLSERATLSFRRSVLTPLNNNPTLTEGYNLKKFDNPSFLRDVYQGRSPYQPVASFTTKEIFPEFWLYKKLFGSYFERPEDWIVYHKKSP